MSLLRTLAACLITLPVLAQPGPRGVTFGHIHLNSAHPEAATAFWTDFIGAGAYTHDSLHGVSMISGTILISQGDPTGPSAGSALDRIVLQVPDLQPFIDKLAKTSYKSSRPSGDTGPLDIEGPDGVRIELNEDSSRFAPLEFGGIQIDSARPSETQAWYAKVFGARPANEDQTIASRAGGAALIFAQAASAAPTAGRAIDHISFEIRGLEAFCKKLADDGIRFDTPYRTQPETHLSSAFLTDPAGVRIELTEGLAH